MNTKDQEEQKGVDHHHQEETDKLINQAEIGIMPATPMQHQADRLIDNSIKSEMEFLSARRQIFDQLVWQIPILSLTGESFLFLISLGSGVSNVARIIASILGIVVAVAAIHSLDRLKTCEWYDARALRVRKENISSEIPDYPILGEGYRRARAKLYKKLWSNDYQSCISGAVCNCEDGFVAWMFYQFTSTRVWTVCFWIIVFANLIILILSSIQQASHNKYF